MVAVQVRTSPVPPPQALPKSRSGGEFIVRAARAVFSLNM